MVNPLGKIAMCKSELSVPGGWKCNHPGGTETSPILRLSPGFHRSSRYAFPARHTRLPQECAGLNCVHAHTDPISLGPQPGFVTRFSEKRVSSNRPPGLSRSSQPAPLLSPHLLLGGELSDRETSGRAAVTVPADACGQRRIRSRTRKLPILPDRQRAQWWRRLRSAARRVGAASAAAYAHW